ncbi:hypothetical protein TanjilG_14383 [Lupinus angustifolius]|uniref:Protein kinase domain-containing protein n=1 Tax=Lupinus angustifolius TaxID=3871 RepID=A0A1J7GQ58_LUPAN|nr:hypothetical protein TanjilG_14383 [Lupinus angustifolius]
MIIFICSIYPLASAQSDCVSTCGSVNIPYPFGMNNPNCYLGKWFEIECRNATSVAARKPYLKYIDMEVTKIDETYSTVDIMNPIFRWNCYGKTDMPVIDLRGSPFVYSQKYDKFIAFGCNKLAFLQSNGTTVGGCVSICDNNEEVNNNFDFGINGCHGRYCCETSLPLYLSEYNTTHADLKNKSSDECNYALIVSEDWLTSYNNYDMLAIPPIFEVKNRSRKWAIVGSSSSLGSIILLFGLWWSYKVVRKRVIKKRKENFFKQNGGLLLQRKLSSDEVCVDKTILFTLKDLERATNNFNMNRVLGKGGQGTVYKGMLEDGKIVAVKKFKVQGKVEEFINEFVILSQINHRNVVKLLGCCLETEIPLLVYEFIPNGNLFEYLHNQNEDLAMTWDIRLRIATEIAGALFYLHSIASQPIYHRDIKSTNILLDEKNRAKVADFGTSRIVSIEATHLTTMVQGTFGYLDPEYFHTSQFTDKSDVYSFGVVLAEILTGRRPIPVVSSEEAMNLASYFVLSMEENNLFDIIDKRLEKEADKEHIIAVANLAYTCLELNGRKRPTMKEVTLELERIGVPNRKFSTNQNHEGIELSRIEDYQHFGGYSMSNTFSTISSQTFS